jgi:5-methylcytosine-specific restriction endonuclease McrA
MASKQELQTTLKKQYGINKNISQALDQEDCEQLVATLEKQPSLTKLVQSFIAKNKELGQNNRYYGQLRSKAEQKFKTLKTECNQLEQKIEILKQQTLKQQTLKQQIATPEQNQEKLDEQHIEKITTPEQNQEEVGEPRQSLEVEIQALRVQNQNLDSRLRDLRTHNHKLTVAHQQLKQGDLEFWCDLINGDGEWGIAKASRVWVHENSDRSCPVCRQRFANRGGWTIDHKLPHSQYPWLSRDVRNLWIICHQCKQEKGEMHWYEYEHYIWINHPDYYQDVAFARPRKLLAEL